MGVYAESKWNPKLKYLGRRAAIYVSGKHRSKHPRTWMDVFIKKNWKQMHINNKLQIKYTKTNKQIILQTLVRSLWAKWQSSNSPPHPCEIPQSSNHHHLLLISLKQRRDQMDGDSVNHWILSSGSNMSGRYIMCEIAWVLQITHRFTLHTRSNPHEVR